MKKIKDYIKVYEDYTTLLSTTSRQLAFAGIAIIWIFKTEQSGTYILPDGLLFPIIAFSLYFCFEFLQYFVASIIWYFFYRYHEKKRVVVTDDPDIEASVYCERTISFFFYLKLCSVFIAYGLLIKFLFLKIQF